MVEQEEPGRDLAGLVVPLAGRLVATGDRWEPYRLVDADGKAVGAAGVYFGHLQAAGRAEPTVRSYGMDLLRWFRFLYALGVAWDRATRSEARDFCRWLQLAGKPVWPHWRERGRPGMAAAVPVAGEVYAPSVRAHSETVLRSFYDFHLEAGTGPLVNPFPLDRSRRVVSFHQVRVDSLEPGRTTREMISARARSRARPAGPGPPGPAAPAAPALPRPRARRRRARAAPRR
jgi:Phage integrase, N-terminal SAM-like domain